MKAVLTGHSRGLGAAIAASLLARGITVLGLSRNGNDVLQAQFPAALRQHRIDLSDTGMLSQWIADGALQRFLSDADVALLINDAAVAQPLGLVDRHEASTVAKAVAVNVAAPLMLASAFAAASEHANDRRILHISSGAGSTAFPGMSIYCATKAALDHHARCVAADSLPRLRICSLSPGIIDTDMQVDVRSQPSGQFPLHDVFEAFKRNGELSSPGDCAERLVAYLLSSRFGETAVADLPTAG